LWIFATFQKISAAANVKFSPLIVPEVFYRCSKFRELWSSNSD